MQRRAADSRYIRLLCQQFCDPCMPDRLERIHAEGAFCDRNTVNIMDPVPCRAPILGKRRQERQLTVVAGLKNRSKFCADIAPQCRIRFLIDVADASPAGSTCQLYDDLICLFRRQMTGLGIHYQNLCITGSKIDLIFYHHAGSCTVSRKLHAGIQCTGKIICNNQ